MVNERTDSKVLQRIRRVVDGGIVSVGEVKRNIKDFITRHNFQMPSHKSILNAIYRYSRYNIFIA